MSNEQIRHEYEQTVIYLVKSYLDDTEHQEQRMLFTEWLEQAKYINKYKYHVNLFYYFNEIKEGD